MIPYGKRKRGSAKIHPHNKCSVCSECKLNKKKERQKSKKDTNNELASLLEKWLNEESNYDKKIWEKLKKEI